jgi:C-terminal processing protease CtpA/Prc
VVHALAEKVREQYVFPDVADKLAQMLTERLARGDYPSHASANEFGETRTRQMRAIAHDAHLRVSYAQKLPPWFAQPKPDAPTPAFPPLMKKGNYGFEEVKILNGNVGYLRLNAFVDPATGGETAASAMEFLGNTDALLIDLRRNMGGTPGMVDMLASYFFPGDKPVHLNDLSLRKVGTTEHTIQQWWTLPYVPGKRYLDKEVYILVGHRTPSAAEEFSYDLKTLKRATIVGETTWGGANPGELIRLTDHFIAFIPHGQAINPITKTNWEGTGVEPDIKIPELEALNAAYVAALHHLIAKANDPQQLSSLQEALTRAEAEHQVPDPQLN